MCNNFPNIRITEGNNFSIILPLLSRTYVATRPIDEEIDPEQLENVVVTFGDVQYPAQQTSRGVQIDLPATLAVGTYNILLTAEYLGSNIRAAYESAVTIVPWSEQSTAEQYITGSPIVLRAAYVLSGAMTDAELEALKEEYREKNAQLEQAIADAEAAKREWEEKAADLDGVAKEATSQEIKTAVENIDIDTTDLAKQGTNPNATLTDVLNNTAGLSDLSPLVSELDAGKAAIVDAINAQGGEASAQQSLGELAQEVAELNTLADTIVFLPTVQRPIDLARYYASTAISYNKAYIKEVHADSVTSTAGSPFAGCGELVFLELNECITSQERLVQGCTKLEKLYIPKMHGLGQYSFLQCANLIDLKFGATLAGNINFSSSLSYNPTIAMNLSNSLCHDTDLQDYGRTFSNNREKWNFCLREHFAALLQDRTGETAYTITFGSAILANMEAETIAAFTDKNWTLA